MGSKLISGKFIQQEGEISNTKRKNLRILPCLDSLMLKIGVCEAKSSFGRIYFVEEFQFYTFEQSYEFYFKTYHIIQ